MNVSYLIVAKYAEQTNDGLNIIGGDIDLFFSETIPLNVPFLFVATKVVLGQEEASVPHSLRVRLVGPDGDQIIESDEIPVPANDFLPKEDRFNAKLVFGFVNVVFLEEGLYRFQLLFDGKAEKDAPLRVARRDADAPAAAQP